MMAADYRHIDGLENRLGRHYSRFPPFSPTPALADQSLALRKLRDAGSNRRSRVKQTGRNIALGKVLQLHRLAAQRNIDRRHDLLDRAETVRLVRPWVPREVHQLVAGQETPRSPVNDLFVGRGRWPGPPTGIIEQHFDRRAVDNV